MIFTTDTYQNDGSTVVEIEAGPVMLSVQFPALFSQRVADELRGLADGLEADE